VSRTEGKIMATITIRFRVLLLCALLMFVAGGRAAQTQTSSPRKPAHAIPPPSKPAGLTTDSILAMVQAGLSDDIIVARLRKEEKPFDLSTEDMIRLKKANVSDNVLTVMMNPRAEIKAPTPQVSPQAATNTVVVQTPTIPGFTIATRSGATPIAGTSVGDIDDPMTPHDSGIYLYTKDRDDKPKMIVLERAAYQGAKTGGAFGTAITYGIKKMKTKAVIAGPRASVRSADPNAVFYFYFDDKAAGLGRSYFGIASVTNPNQFALIKLDVAKANRETLIMEANAFGVSSSTNEKAMIGFKSERLRSGIYRVVMNGPLQAGEYCFLASALGTGAAGAVDIFDFGVSVQ